jgi:hypothetical protein
MASQAGLEAMMIRLLLPAQGQLHRGVPLGCGPRRTSRSFVREREAARREGTWPFLL